MGDKSNRSVSGRARAAWRALAFAGIVVGALTSSGGPGGVGGDPARAEGAQTEPVDLVLTTEDSVRIAATFYSTTAELPPAVLLVHMWNQSREDWDSFARSLTNRGYAVLTIDLRGHGGSARGGGEDDDAEPGPEETQLFTNDIRTGIRFLREREDIDGVRVALVGASIGANAAVAYSVDDHLLSGLILLSPALEYQGIRADHAMHGYGNRPCLMIAAKGDPVSFHSLPILQKKAQGKVETFRVEGDAHGTDLIEDPAVRGTITTWLADLFKER